MPYCRAFVSRKFNMSLQNREHKITVPWTSQSSISVIQLCFQHLSMPLLFLQQLSSPRERRWFSLPLFWCGVDGQCHTMETASRKFTNSGPTTRGWHNNAHTTRSITIYLILPVNFIYNVTRCLLTFRSRSEPNNARLLSFQSYFLALTSPLMANKLVQGIHYYNLDDSN